MSDVGESSQGWLAQVLDEALQLGVLTPAVLLAHATPEVLAERLPRDLMVKVFASAFATGKLTPEGILAVAPPSVLVAHLAPAILWAAMRDAAERARLVADGELPKGRTPPRQLLSGALREGLSRGVVTAHDVARHLPPSTWVGEVPLEVVAGLMSKGLTQGTWDAATLLSLLTPAVIGEHLATPLAWRVLDEAAGRALNLGG